MLDRAREYAGIPFVLTSTLRTKDENNMVGGTRNSTHLRGLAVDIRALDSRSKYKILTGLIAVGFNRLGIYDTHIHADIDQLFDKEVVWLG